MEGLTKENGEHESFPGGNKTQIYNQNIPSILNEVEKRNALVHTVFNHGETRKKHGVIIFDNSYL